MFLWVDYVIQGSVPWGMSWSLGHQVLQVRVTQSKVTESWLVLCDSANGHNQSIVRLPDLRLAGLFGVFAGAAIVLALDQAFEEFGHRDVIILRHFEREDFGFRSHPKFDFLSLFSYKFWHFGLFWWSPEYHAALR